ncbi:hypothetical protein DFH09DRAFT_1111790 [Mycena vulgaris]|nr:hypothetical protein DFH09DRAFT_1111790 [Mycena vulgaris]
MDDTEMISPSGRWILYLHWTLSKDVGVKGPGKEGTRLHRLGWRLVMFGSYHRRVLVTRDSRGGGQWTCALFIRQYIEIGNGDGWQTGYQNIRGISLSGIESKPWDEHLFTKEKRKVVWLLVADVFVRKEEWDERAAERRGKSEIAVRDRRGIGACESVQGSAGEVKPDHRGELSKCRWWDQLFKPSGLSHTATHGFGVLDAATRRRERADGKNRWQVMKEIYLPRRGSSMLLQQIKGLGRSKAKGGRRQVATSIGKADTQGHRGGE